MARLDFEEYRGTRCAPLGLRFRSKPEARACRAGLRAYDPARARLDREAGKLPAGVGRHGDDSSVGLGLFQGLQELFNLAQNRRVPDAVAWLFRRDLGRGMSRPLDPVSDRSLVRGLERRAVLPARRGLGYRAPSVASPAASRASPGCRPPARDSTSVGMRSRAGEAGATRPGVWATPSWRSTRPATGADRAAVRPHSRPTSGPGRGGRRAPGVHRRRENPTGPARPGTPAWGSGSPAPRLDRVRLLPDTIFGEGRVGLPDHVGGFRPGVRLTNRLAVRLPPRGFQVEADPRIQVRAAAPVEAVGVVRGHQGGLGLCAGAMIVSSTQTRGSVPSNRKAGPSPARMLS